jgi:hypothetical protein
MSAPALPRPHRRALTQLLLGLVPLFVIGVVLLIALGLRLADVRAPLAAATATGEASVVASGQGPDGRGVSVTIDSSPQRTGTLLLAQPQRVAAGASVAVRYDPGSPVDDTAVYADGDAAHRALQDVVYGLVLVAFVLVVAAAVTGFRVLARRRLRRAPASDATATRLVGRRGLTVRSWLELHTTAGRRWLPVHWSPELALLEPGGGITLLGDPAHGRLVLPVIDGAEVWPSGRLRVREPRGELRGAEPGAAASQASWARQVRSDVVVVIAAPLLGLLWSYLDRSGVGSFLVTTFLAAGVLFWLTELVGSDPAPPAR